ncbi:glycosyltransferase [Lapidilactobacillus dextrinicus]|uniref:glycosyltransferase n=1 Tax=Lapidilactobacillus dextrinicus TaxID=51664 RepID=UPI0022E602EC|nr:glycosyltransferase [Lapidilactobacillus dextrinicus]
MNKPYNIAVVISTYNGSAYIKEQIDSIIKSVEYAERSLKYVIVVRDDGSSDNTIEILKEFQNEGLPIELIIDGQTLGFKESFHKLLQYVNGRSDYIFLSDQDDIWKIEKVTRFVETFKRSKETQPFAVYSDLEMFGDDLSSSISMSEYSHFDHKKDSYQYWMLTNNVTGAALAINSSAVEIICKLTDEVWRTEKYHDWLIIRTISAIGGWQYIDQTLTQYRQHQSNASHKFQRKRVLFKDIRPIYYRIKHYYWDSIVANAILIEELRRVPSLEVKQIALQLDNELNIVLHSKRLARLKYISTLSRFVYSDRVSITRKKLELIISLLVN